MPTYTIEPLAGTPPSVPGQISLDGATETGAIAGIFYESATERVFFPGNIILTAISFALSFGGGPTLAPSQSGTRLQKVDTTLNFVYLVDHPADIDSFTDVVADDAGLIDGTFPYFTAPDGAYLYLEFDAESGLTVTGGLVSVDWRPRGWHLGRAGSGGSW